jgi:hypothetical protein
MHSIFKKDCGNSANAVAPAKIVIRVGKKMHYGALAPATTPQARARPAPSIKRD